VLTVDKLEDVLGAPYNKLHKKFFFLKKTPITGRGVLL
jgi:hypothetical protein